MVVTVVCLCYRISDNLDAKLRLLDFVSLLQQHFIKLNQIEQIIVASIDKFLSDCYHFIFVLVDSYLYSG